MSDEPNKRPPPKSIEELLKLLALGTELTESQQKEMKDYKFWKTQPVPRLNEKIVAEGPIEPPKTPADVSDTPLPLLRDFEWSDIDLDQKLQLQEVYELLYDHYVEDQDATFRFQYSPEFFNWALKCPGWNKDWHAGVRVRATGKLVAFIAATPINLKLTKSQTTIPSVEINFLCIHKKLRSKRLAPVMIKEITRRVNKCNIWQALYTAGVVLPSPVSVCRYTHRPLNWAKLNDVEFSHLPSDQTRASMCARYALPDTTNTPGLRPMEWRDVDQVFNLLTRYEEKFELIQVFDRQEVAHWFLGTTDDARKPVNDVVKTYVVENDGKVTDFFLYYLLPFTVLNNTQHKELGIAYLYYYATELAFLGDQKAYQARLVALINDALITAKLFGVDVFNCLLAQDNLLFINKCKFGSGDGFLNYYLFNYKTWPIYGGIDPQTKEVTEDKGSGIGVVLK